MNERIKQLALQAGLKSEIMVDESNLDVECFLTQYDANVPSIHYWEKFAELIVKECCHIMNTTAKKAEESNTYMGDDVPTRVHQYKIKQHFGVEL